MRILLLFSLLLSLFSLNAQQDTLWFLRGFYASDSAKFEESVIYFSKAIELNSKYANAYYDRALAEDTLGRYKEAINDYTKAIELNSKDTASYFNRAHSNFF